MLCTSYKTWSHILLNTEQIGIYRVETQQEPTHNHSLWNAIISSILTKDIQAEHC